MMKKKKKRKMRRRMKMNDCNDQLNGSYTVNTCVR
jgi:hypothetical protein